MALMLLVGGAGSGAFGMACNIASRRNAAGEPVHAIASDGDGMRGGSGAGAATRMPGQAIPAAELACGALPPRTDGDALVVVGSLACVMEATGAAGDAFERVVDALARRDGDTLVVAEPAGEYLPAGRADKQAVLRARGRIGGATARLARAADASYLVVAGHAVDLTTLPTDVTWPED